MQAFGSLYDVLRDESLQTQVNENQMQILQDIARGLRFLHAANPQVRGKNQSSYAVMRRRGTQLTLRPFHFAGCSRGPQSTERSRRCEFPRQGKRLRLVGKDRSRLCLRDALLDGA